jgi:hypothetical protein
MKEFWAIAKRRSPKKPNFIPNGLNQADSMICFRMESISNALTRMVRPSSSKRSENPCNRGQNYTWVATPVDFGEMIAVSGDRLRHYSLQLPRFCDKKSDCSRL